MNQLFKIQKESCNVSFSTKVNLYSNFSYESSPNTFLFSDETWTLKVNGTYDGRISNCITFTINSDYVDFENVDFYVTANLSTSGQIASSKKFTFSNGSFTSGFINCYLNHSYHQTLTIDIKCAPISSTINPSITKTVFTTVSSMLDDAEFSDFKFIVNEKEFNVHKCILAAASDSFAKIFKVNEAFWKITEIDEEIFGHLLRFIYSGKIPENLDKIAIKMYEAAEVFKISELKEMSSKKIHASLSLENSLETYKWAYIYDLEVLKTKAWELVKRDVLKINFKMKEEPLKPEEIKEIIDYQKKDKEFWDKFKAE